ncbi:MAG: hypothetical protein ABI036_07655 [Fibrobacteria bacterium]
MAESRTNPIGKSLNPQDANSESGKSQLALDGLMREISRCRSEIARRESLLSGLRQRLLAEAYPLQEKVLAIRIETFRILGRHLQSGRLQRRARKLLEQTLYDVAEELETAFGADLRADRRWIFAEEGMAGKDAGEEVDTDDADEGNDDEYLGSDGYRESDFPDRGRATDSARGEASQAGPTGAAGKAGKTGSAGNAGRMEADRDHAAAGDIRALYLMLARALHPDKESDPTLREEKTAWMQKVTAAYSERNLAGLLDILALNPLQAVAPYLSQAPAQTLRGFAKRLRRELEALRAQAARIKAGIDPFLARFLTGERVNEFALNSFLADARKEINFLKSRRDIYRTTAGVEELVNALRSRDWRELL